MFNIIRKSSKLKMKRELNSSIYSNDKKYEINDNYV